MSLTLCTTTTSDQAESRKTSVRSPSAAVGSSNHLNSLQSSQDKQTQSIQQSQQNTNGQTTYRVPTSDYTSITQPQSPLYTQFQTGQGPPAGGYFIQVSPNALSGAQPGGALSAGNRKNVTRIDKFKITIRKKLNLILGPTPVIMQYLPHNAQQGAIQYLQLIPTRPLIVPISPYISTYNNPYTPQPTAQASSSSPYVMPHHHHHSYSPSPSPSSHSYGSSYQNPVGGYSTNYLTYFRPNQGMQLINAPVDLSLNTNEYIPMKSENSYTMRRA